MIRGLMVVGLFLLALVGSQPDGVPVGELYYAPPPADPGDVVSFPGCEGYGCVAWQTTRDSIVNHGMALNFYPVTTDDSTGTGSLVSGLDSAQASCQRGDAAIVYVKTGGLTNWNGLTTNQTDWKLCNTQVIGTTSQGGGLTITHEGTGTSTGRINGGSDNLIMRGLRQRWMSTGGWIIYGGDKIVRTNWSTGVAVKTSGNGYWGAAGSPWSVVPNAEFSNYLTHDYILSGHVAEHPTLMRAGGRYSSINRSVLEGPGYRIPMIGGGHPDSIPGVDFTNSIAFNQGSRGSATMGNTALAVQFRNVWYKLGVKTDTTDFNDSSPVHMDDTCTTYAESTEECHRSVHVDNLLHYRNGYDSTTFDQDSSWNGSQAVRLVVCRNVDSSPSASDSANVYFQLEQPLDCPTDGNKANNINPGFTAPRRDTAWTAATYPVTMAAADTASIWDAVKDSVGFSWAITCSGVRTSVRDSLDSAIIDSVAAGTGRSTTIDLDTISWSHIEVPATGTACTDSDGDHLYDLWELEQVGDLSTLTASSLAASGWLAFELMANGSSWAGGGGGGSTTYPSGRDVYLPPWVTDTVVRGSDTVVRTIPDPDSLDIESERALYWYAPGHDSAYVISCGTPAMSGNLTEAEADSVHDDWGLPQDPDTATVGGC